jgi:hypothetical protein
MSTTEPTAEFEEPWPNYSTPQSKTLMANESWGRTGFEFYHKANRREMAEALERVERQAGEAALSQLAMASNDGWARCDKCGQKLASDEDDGEPYCLNCETCSRCQGIHHMEDRCQDATDAEAALSQFTPERIRKAWIATGASWCSLDRAQRVYAALTEKPQETPE